jgi:glycerophosphoryl diester phosphodiesterase
VPHKYSGSIYILCFNPKLLEFAYNKAQAYKYVFNLSGASLTQASYPSYIHGLCLPIANLSGSFMEKAKTGGYSVLTYSCNTLEQATKALDLGAEVIMTDNPGRLCGYLKRVPAS